RLVHLRTLQTGVHTELSQRLLNEVAAARVCLLDAGRKTAYDAALVAVYEALAAPLAPPHQTPPPEPVEFSTLGHAPEATPLAPPPVTAGPRFDEVHVSADTPRAKPSRARKVVKA